MLSILVSALLIIASSSVLAVPARSEEAIRINEGSTSPLDHRNQDGLELIHKRVDKGKGKAEKGGTGDGKGEGEADKEKGKTDEDPIHVQIDADKGTHGGERGWHENANFDCYVHLCLKVPRTM